jgi:DNA-binding response OmpR family regulator
VAAALDAGADCALTGPIRPAELRARVRALTQRRERRLSVGALVLDGAARNVWLDGAPLALPAREFEVLRFLASAPGRVFTKQELQRACWSAVAPPARSRTLERHVARLRGRLGPHGSMLVTVWAVGYRLDPPA